MVNKFFRSSRNLFILAAILAVVVFFLILAIISSSTKSGNSNGSVNIPGVSIGQQAGGPTPVPAPALQAQQDIPALTQFTNSGTPAAAKYFVEVTPPAGLIGYVPGAAGLDNQIALRANVLGEALPKGHYLLTTELVTGTAPGTLDYSGILAKGTVAQSLSLPALQSVNGSIQTGDHVNLILSLKFDVRKRDVDAGKFKTYFPTDSNVTSATDPNKSIGYIYESQTMMENLKILNVVGNVYTLQMTNQEAVFLKFFKDAMGSADARFVADMVVRADGDTSGRNQFFRTDMINTDSPFNGKYTHNNTFVIP